MSIKFVIRYIVLLESFHGHRDRKQYRDIQRIPLHENSLLTWISSFIYLFIFCIFIFYNSFHRAFFLYIERTPRASLRCNVNWIKGISSPPTTEYNFIFIYFSFLILLLISFPEKIAPLSLSSLSYIPCLVCHMWIYIRMMYTYIHIHIYTIYILVIHIYI